MHNTKHCVENTIIGDDLLTPSLAKEYAESLAIQEPYQNSAWIDEDDILISLK